MPVELPGALSIYSENSLGEEIGKVIEKCSAPGVNIGLSPLDLQRTAGTDSATICDPY